MPLVSVDVSHGVGTLTLSDADRRNAISLALANELVHSVAAVEADPDARAIVITGAGSAFCSGADLQALRSADEAVLRQIYDAFVRVTECHLPTIAAVNGPAVGAGFNLAIACDVRIAGESARFDSRFIAMPIHPGGGHLWMLERLVGPQAAAALTLFGEPVTGRRAADIGLAWSCVPDDQLLGAARALCERLVTSPAGLGRRIKRSLARSRQLAAHADAVELELVEQLWCLGQPDYLDRLSHR